MLRGIIQSLAKGQQEWCLYFSFLLFGEDPRQSTGQLQEKEDQNDLDPFI